MAGVLARAYIGLIPRRAEPQVCGGGFLLGPLGSAHCLERCRLFQGLGRGHRTVCGRGALIFYLRTVGLDLGLGVCLRRENAAHIDAVVEEHEDAALGEDVILVYLADRLVAETDRTANRKEKSRGHSKVIQGRAKNWEDVNKKSLDEVRRALMAAENDSADEDEDVKDAAAAGEGQEDKGAETDEEMDAAPVVAGKETAAAAAPAASDELDEEIL
ncbi:hypothetical protein BN1723_007096 [Verticillium longisporum]|uniref:Uncharacterized protein n=1 Tax=Verticillium longisporum TaxID=100787 RepID=A0A0G4NJ80_VERLO|nr:hypothetical protein BN1723_007096 [Verticillium longisporum]